ncbi:MAG: hypothetical protein ACXADC_09680 [Candidatus Thorarchaeota archaeon]
MEFLKDTVDRLRAWLAMSEVVQVVVPQVKKSAQPTLENWMG